MNSLEIGIETNEVATNVTGSKNKIDVLVNALRLVSSDEDIANRRIFIPDGCEIYGFSEGYHNLSVLLHYLADMIEE